MKQEIYHSIQREKIVAIIRGLEYDQNLRVIEGLIESGIINLEVTLNTKDALKVIEEARKRYDGLAHMGAGTVKNGKDAKEALDAGAQFLISPNLSEEAIAVAKERGVLMIPGVFSPTEIFKAYDLGCEMVKIFPIGALGTDYIKQVKGPLNQIKMMAVGGIDAENGKVYLKNGADALGIGGSLIWSDYVKQGEYGKLKKHFMAVKEGLKTIG